ncbi:hypothetical protein D0962_16150 [Leptolyngbyaceae cyanobacterium CCMR0082]|uniref:vWA-MoxR associated protein N-terminal HTH domain-containing protein n=2 Tax=Adonisia turfae TaxID=2950184 RepID=A0A6M0S769_9CYAN|nr:AAA-like domain-containing protein [Adonisia turfae]NEZ57682.1 hypothetical protein [Adonisia turfae CCMR0081]NEZ64305.1 hypothetical protein [Adonisia turfae CCMR0082]
MTPDEIVHVLNATGQKQLLPVQELILRQSWEGETYASMAEELHYDAAYLKKVAFELWHLLSDTFETPISKVTLRPILEPQSLAPHQKQFLEDSQSLLGRQVYLTELCFKSKFPAGSIPVGSALYISHPTIEDMACQEISEPGGMVRIKAPRRMGKSSLLLRMLSHAAVQNYRTVYLDCQEIDGRLKEDQTKFLRWFCANISYQLDLEPKLDDYWDVEMGARLSSTLYIEQYILRQLKKPLVLFVDDADLLLQHIDMARCFFSVLRSWHERAKRIVSMQNLRLVVTYCSEFHSFLDISQSLCNVGLPIKLPYFSLNQMQQLAGRYKLHDSEGNADITWLSSLLAMTGGHPYLVQLAFYNLCQGAVTVRQLLRDAPTLASIYQDHLRGYLVALQLRPELIAALKDVMTAEQSTKVDPMLAYELDSMGLIQLQGNQVIPSCELYRLYFSAQLS